MATAQLEIDPTQIERLGRLFKLARIRAPAAIGRAVRRTGDMTKTRVVRALVKQTGLKRKVIVKAVKAKWGGETYSLRTRGGDVSLKYFGARETRRGVSAAPWNKRRIFSGTFTRGGRFPDRVGLNLGGHVFARAGRSRLPIEKKKSGLFIPKEMVSGASRGAFINTVRTVLPMRLRHEIARILGGAA